LESTKSLGWVLGAQKLNSSSEPQSPKNGIWNPKSVWLCDISEILYWKRKYIIWPSKLYFSSSIWNFRSIYIISHEHTDFGALIFGLWWLIFNFSPPKIYVFLLQGKSLRYSTWIGRGLFKMLQISLFGLNQKYWTQIFSFCPKKKKFVSICGVLFFCTKPTKSKLAYILCICGSIFTFLDIF
jgi:hypothetical protein